ncbi:MAG: ankyrin repeat domain-containing protein [Candidatus Omnitrophica bacterium]|nr:ankyrin repeat domain-containing protein [Candidatus Omnitrophota bacterium]
MLGRSRKLRSLIDRFGEDVIHLRRHDGKTTLHCAAIAGNLPGVKYLVMQGIAVDAQDRQGWTALHYAAGGNHTAIIRFLLENGADIAKTNSNGQTAYDVSLQKGFTNASQILRQYVSNRALVAESGDR